MQARAERSGDGEIGPEIVRIEASPKEATCEKQYREDTQSLQ